MKIRRIRIDEYGPLRGLSVEPSDFDVIFGLNEAGKTALVEVLAHILFRKTTTSLRYGKPVGAVVEIEHEGNTYTLPGKRILADLPGADVANLMYVQASESSVFSDKGTRFWDGVKSMLSKVDAGVPFAKLDSEIFKAVELQPSKVEWQRSKEMRIENERRRKEALGIYLEKIGGIGKKETELAALVRKNVLLKREIEAIGRSKAYRDYEEMKRSYDAYTEARSAVQDYERYKDDYFVRWQKLDIERKAKSDEGRRAREIEAELDELKRRKETLEETDRRSVAYGLKDFSAREVKSSAPRSLLLSIIVVVAAAFATALSFFIDALRLPAVVFDGVALALLVYSVYRHYSARNAFRDRERLLERAREVFPNITGLDELAARIEKSKEELIRTDALIDEKKRGAGGIAVQRSVEVIETELADLRAKTGLAEVADLEKKISEKNKKVAVLQSAAARLSTLLHESDPNKWQRMIDERKVVRPEGDADISAERDLVKEQSDIQYRIDEFTREINVFRAVQREQAGVTDDHAALVEFHALDQALRGYDLEKEAALKAREFLRSMSEELDQFIHGVLQGRDSLSEFIHTVTGTYEKVLVEDEDFVAEDRTGARFLLRDLSSGTQDQLLFCFRLAALKKIYPKGAFMILDDAFIFADWQRRERLVGLLRHFMGQGNQVLYLTSDDHTRDLLAKHGARVTSLK